MNVCIICMALITAQVLRTRFQDSFYQCRGSIIASNMRYRYSPSQEDRPKPRPTMYERIAQLLLWQNSVFLSTFCAELVICLNKTWQYFFFRSAIRSGLILRFDKTNKLSDTWREYSVRQSRVTSCRSHVS